MHDPLISTDGAFFYLVVPSEEPGVTRTHTLRFPVSRAQDMARWLLLRKEREVHHQHRARIGTAHSPTQAMIDAFLANGGEIDSPESRRRKEAEAHEARLLAEYGLSSADLDLDI